MVNAYIANLSGNVSVVEVSSNTITQTITVGGKPTGAAVSSDGSITYIVNNDIPNLSTISVIDNLTNTVTSTIPLGVANCYFVAITPDKTKAYVTTGATYLAVIDVASNAVSSTISLGGIGMGVAIKPDGSKVYKGFVLLQQKSEMFFDCICFLFAARIEHW